MCEEEGTRGGDGTVEAARCGIVGKGKRWVVLEVPLGVGQWMRKWKKVMRKMLGKAHLSLAGG